MKPSFALVLTQDAIGLLHRTSQGWQPIGEVAVADPALTEALGFLRTSALGLEPNGLATKVVIPNSEILYTTVHAAGPSAAARRSQIRAALEGRTPYAVKELVFDWSGSGPEVKVAVVARETLAEAEAFAAEHRLGPLSFVGSAVAGTFDGEPWFGPAAGAASLLPPGEKVERDHSPVPGPEPEPPASVPEPEPEPAAQAAPVEGPAEPVTVAAPAPDPVPPLPAAPEPVAEPAVVEMAVDLAEMAAAPTAADPGAPSPEPAWTEPASLPVEVPTLPVVEPAADVEPPARPMEPLRAPVDVPVAGLLDDPLPPPLGRPVRGEVIAQSLEVPPDDEPDVLPARGSPAPAVERLKARLAEQPMDARRFGGGSSGLGAAPPPLGPPSAQGKNGALPSVAARTLKSVPGPAVAARAASGGTRPAGPARVSAKGAIRGAASMVTSPSIPMPRDRRVNIPSSDSAADERARANAEARKTARAEGDGLTAFGAKQTRRGKPKYLGLILTGVLLVALAVLAALSSYFISAEDPVEAVPVATAPATPTPGPVAEPATAKADPRPVAPPAEAGTATTAAGSAPEPAFGTEEPAVGPEAAESLAPAASPEPGDAASTTHASSGGPAEAAATYPDPAAIPQPEVTASVGRNPALEPQDEIFLAMTDPAVSIADLVALAPPVAEADPAPAQQPLPPPFGTVYQFDANGLILPTADGIVTPEGVRLVLGKPPRVPPARPVAADAGVETATPAAAPAPEAPAPETPAPETPAAAASVAGVVTPETLPETLPAAEEPALVSDPALAGARPRSRPADLTPAAGDDAALPPADDTRLTSLRPRERPEALQGAAGTTALAEETAAIQSAAASLVTAVPEDADVSPLAIAVSRKPAPRPRDLSRAVEAAVAAIEPAPPAQQETVEEPVAVAAAPEPRARAAAAAIAPAEPAAKPREDPAEAEVDEPEAASAAPDLPTRANVAKQATFRNAINLSRVNLIGVYGSSSNRYALVRQANGRYIKVEVGDRVDGGRVAAISDRELSYVKNGRTVTLSMPRG